MEEKCYLFGVQIIEAHLEQLNQEFGNIADEALHKFVIGSKTLSNLIKAEISGIKGEKITFNALNRIRSTNIVLKNVELNDGNRHSEIDAIVITPGVITIIETKNTGKNIFIDENGNYFRNSNYLAWDCNIAEKMSLKEELLRKTLDAEGIKDFDIKKILIFTNNKIEVHNKHPSYHVKP